MKQKYVHSLKKNFDNDQYIDFLIDSAEFIKQSIGDFKPEFLVTLGSGLSSLVQSMDIIAEVAYSSIPDFPVTTNKSHAGKFVFGTLNGKKLICMNGRLHAYEGYKMFDIVAPLRISKLLGADKAIITNAVGGINRNYKIGDFIITRDAITLFIESPLAGPNIDIMGERFFDLSKIYDPEYIEISLQAAKDLGLSVHSGVLAQTVGPHFESIADVKVLETLGADTVGMSSVCEAIAAAHLKMRVIGINFISNLASGISDVEITDEDVNLASQKHGKNFVKLVNKILASV